LIGVGGDDLVRSALRARAGRLPPAGDVAIVLQLRDVPPPVSVTGAENVQVSAKPLAVTLVTVIAAGRGPW
jgi:hypothetical protein